MNQPKRLPASPERRVGAFTISLVDTIFRRNVRRAQNLKQSLQKKGYVAKGITSVWLAFLVQRKHRKANKKATSDRLLWFRACGLFVKKD